MDLRYYGFLLWGLTDWIFVLYGYGYEYEYDLHAFNESNSFLSLQLSIALGIEYTLTCKLLMDLISFLLFSISL